MLSLCSTTSEGETAKTVSTGIGRQPVGGMNFDGSTVQCTLRKLVWRSIQSPFSAQPAPYHNMSEYCESCSYPVQDRHTRRGVDDHRAVVFSTDVLPHLASVRANADVALVGVCRRVPARFAENLRHCRQRGDQALSCEPYTVRNDAQHRIREPTARRNSNQVPWTAPGVIQTSNASICERSENATHTGDLGCRVNFLVV